MRPFRTAEATSDRGVGKGARCSQTPATRGTPASLLSIVVSSRDSPPQARTRAARTDRAMLGRIGLPAPNRGVERVAGNFARADAPAQLRVWSDACERAPRAQ